MKSILLTLALSLLTTAAVRAELIYYEGFNYVNGSIIYTGTNVDGTTNWFRHSGTANPSDSVVANNKLQVSASSPGALPRTDDVNRPFTSVTSTNTTQVVFASFTVNCTNLPPAVGTYFAHFFISTTTFHGRVFAQAGTLPGTWRLGISGAAGTVNKVYPADLSTNVDYQVTVQWDPVTTFAATLWVNPIASTDPSVTSADAVTAPPTVKGYGIRQGGSFGSFFCTLSNLAAATTFEEASTNVWSTNAVSPIIVRSSAAGTNFAGDAVNLIALAAGQGQGSLIYQWQKDGVDVSNPNGNSNVFNIASAAISDTGNYQMITTTPFGLSVTSTPAFRWVTNAPVPPTISPQTPSSTTAYFHQTATLHVVASGPPTLTYAWYYTNAPVSHANVSGDGTDTLTITDVTATNDTAGAYYVVVSNPYGSKTSTVATVTALAPPAVSVAYLRTLVDPVNYNATNSSLPFQVTGTVTTLTNLTTGNTSSYFLQDSTAGINIFATFGSAFRPALGDVVAFIGVLSSFNSTLELAADTVNNLATSYTVLSNDLASLPAPKVIPFNITNSLAYVENSIEGSVVMLTNVFFGTNAGNLISTNANTVATVTNGAGETFNVFFSFQDQDTANQTLPAFAWSVLGVLNQNLGNAATPRNAGYQLVVTRFSDIVTDAPPAVTSSLSGSSSKVLSWTAVPYNYSYSVLTATNVDGPYVPESRFQATMLGVGEVPATVSTATGFGTVALSPDQSTITMNMSFSGLTSPATAAHIHGPGAVGVNAGVLFPLSGVPAATSGSIPEQSFSINPTQVGYLLSGQLYVNVHNSSFPGGEIRGQLTLVPSVGATFTTVNGAYTDINASGTQKFYRVVSP